jgi:hypothetical protein
MGGAFALVVVVIVFVIVVVGGSSSGPSAVNWSTPAGVKVYGALGPEGVPLEVGATLAAADAGLTGKPIDDVQCNSSEQLAYHHHAHLAIFINGQPRSLPLGVGMVPPLITSSNSRGVFATGSQTCLYWIHVHAQDGIIHIESPQTADYILGQFFGIWQQPLSSSTIGAYHGKVTATVDGKTWSADPSEIPLAEHAQIVLNLGVPMVSPPAISWSGTGL